ncbi:MAG TPA: hypothetical protein DGP39_06015, partial [Verrucomicrobiales bacterium]|nr:hypothetical protein [Verrucomicrobiales bacterium]
SKAVVKKEKSSAQPTKKDKERSRLARLEKELKVLEKNAVKRTNIIAADEAAKPGDIEIAIRGNVHNAGPKTPRRFIEVLNRKGLPKIASKASGRAELANWLASAEHP